MESSVLFYFSMSACKKHGKNVWFAGLSHGKCWKAFQFDLYFVQFLNQGIANIWKKNLIVFVVSIYQICLFYKENIKKNGKIKLMQYLNTIFFHTDLVDKNKSDWISVSYSKAN